MSCWNCETIAPGHVICVEDDLVHGGQVCAECHKPWSLPGGSPLRADSAELRAIKTLVLYNVALELLLLLTRLIIGGGHLGHNYAMENWRRWGWIDRTLCVTFETWLRTAIWQFIPEPERDSAAIWRACFVIQMVGMLAFFGCIFAS